LSDAAHGNCAIAARNMEMLANSLGPGTCWAGFLPVAAGLAKKIARRLGIFDDRNIYRPIMLGYPTHVYRKTAPRRRRQYGLALGVVLIQLREAVARTIGQVLDE
jgi:nitroreductase